MEVRVRRAGLWPVLLALLPLLPSWWYAAVEPWPPLSVDDDNAVLEMAERRALHGGQLTGAYSRFGWSHPGPAQFALMAPVYLATGRKAASLYVAALFLSTLFTAAAAWSAARILGPRRGLVAAAVLALLLARMGPALVAHAWGPHAVVLPLALLFVLALGGARHGEVWLPAIAFVASFLVQTNVATGPVVLAAALTALLLAGRAGRRLAALRSLLLTAGVLAALWAPPLLEQLRGTAEHPGNLTLLWRFFRTHDASHSFIEVFGPVARELGSLPVVLGKVVVPSTSDQRDVGAGTLTLVLLAVLPLALAAARRRRDDDVSALSWLALAGAGAALFSGLRIVGDILDYLLFFVSAVSFSGWTAVALAGERPLEERGRGRAVAAACAAVAVLCAVSNARGLARQQPIPTRTLESVRTFSTALESHLAAGGIRRPLVKLTGGEPWVPAAGVILELERAGVRCAVEESWTFMFGRDRRPTGTEDGAVLFTEETRQDLALLAESGKTKLYAAPRAVR